MFCDVVGSTALGETTDPETMRRILERYFERMRAIVEHDGGTVRVVAISGVWPGVAAPSVVGPGGRRSGRRRVPEPGPDDERR